VWVNITQANVQEWFENQEEFERVMAICRMFNAIEIVGLTVH
jgi:hypothetical protein